MAPHGYIARARSASCRNTCRSTPGPLIRCGKVQPQHGASILQFQPFRIAADAAPVAIRRTHQLGGIKPHGLRVIGVHMRNDFGFGRNQSLRARKIEQNIGRLEIDDAAKAGDKMRAGDVDPVKSEIAKIGEQSAASGCRSR